MALAATTSPQGFELLRYTHHNEVLYVPGDPGDTFTRGDQVVSTVGEGLLDPGAANEGGHVGNVLETVVCSAETQAFPKPADFDPADKTAATKCLIPIRPNVPAGVPIYLATFANHDDEDVAAYVSATRTLTITNAAGGNDYYNGALVYVYEGPGIGEVNVAADYVDATPAMVMHRPFATDLTTASKIIILGGEAVASRGVGFFNRCESADEDNVTVNQGSDDGDWVIYLDFRDAAKYLRNLTVPVIPARYLMLA